MPSLAALRQAVDAAFVVTGAELSGWPAPHPDRAPLDEEYSRCLDPGKWRILPARGEAWTRAFVDLGLAKLERDSPVTWSHDDGRTYAAGYRLVPRHEGALTLILAAFAFEGTEPNGIVVGAGDPAVVCGSLPDCGCDACDDGSQPALDALDAHIIAVVTGRFRHLTDGTREIVVDRPDGWRASGRFGRREVDGVLADPTGWREVTGHSWLGE